MKNIHDLKETFGALKINDDTRAKITIVEKVFISGPWLVGWLYGVLQFEPREVEFKISFFSFLLFVSYLLLLSLGRLFSSFFEYENMIFILNSFFCILYLCIGFWSVYVTLKQKIGKPANASLVESLVDSLFIN